ncbi:glycoside hydrolase family 130 protein [Sphingomonas radiodurans]|uniref:glycoside hydrolase family 130 protein n=1 Tax=Sphingomonas radiodurans TaxID=2890321 RepID=UPI001E2B77E3|nr:glycosidase [Sphingomonas radiodurans]WBH17065.1 glycosidase [Sphingomonas radiodurans]
MHQEDFPLDHLVFSPDDVDLSRSPLAGQLGEETYVLGAFNPGMTRLPNGNILLMVRIAEALRAPIRDGNVRAIRWQDGAYVLDAWPLDLVDTTDPRKFMVRGDGWKVMALTSLSWLLPVELDPEGRRIEAIRYDRAIAPRAPYQTYGVEDARISRVGDRYLMTTCSVSPERHSTTLYTSPDAIDWKLEGIVLDHQNKDMLIFEGQIGGHYWAQTRPLGDLYFAYPPNSEWRAGPSINLAASPDALHWKPSDHPGIRPHAATVSTARIGGGAPPVLTTIDGQEGWMTLWHGVEPSGVVGIYRTYWTLLDKHEPWRTLATQYQPLLSPNPALTAPLEDKMYIDDVVFTTGIADAGHYWIVASGEADLACRITHIPKDRLGQVR